MSRRILSLCLVLAACHGPDDAHAERRIEAVGTYEHYPLFGANEVHQFARSGRWLCAGTTGEAFRVGFTTTCPDSRWIKQ